MAKILIKNGRVWDGEIFFYADVITENNKIVKIEPNIKDEANFVYDAEGKTVSAGLVDAHTHLRGVSTDRFGTQAEISCFPFGVTAAADASGEKGDKTLLDSFMLKNVVFAKVKFQNDHADFTKTEERLSAFGEKAVGVKVYFDASTSDITSVIPLSETCEFAHARDLRVMVHCTNSPVAQSEILETLGKGDILTHSFNGSANNAEADGFKSMKAAQKRGVLIDVGFAGNVHADFGILRRAIENGVIPDIISTDITRLSAFVRGGRYGMTMCMSIAKYLGMSEIDIFKAVTSNPAKALGKESELGCLKIGGEADIAVISECAEPFDLTDKNGNRVQSDTGYRCFLTMSGGQIVYKY